MTICMESGLGSVLDALFAEMNRLALLYGRLWACHLDDPLAYDALLTFYAELGDAADAPPLFPAPWQPGGNVPSQPLLDLLIQATTGFNAYETNFMCAPDPGKLGGYVSAPDDLVLVLRLVTPIRDSVDPSSTKLWGKNFRKLILMRVALAKIELKMLPLEDKLGFDRVPKAWRLPKYRLPKGAPVRRPRGT